MGIRTPDRIAPMHPFQGCTLNHSDIFPKIKKGFLNYQPDCRTPFQAYCFTDLTGKTQDTFHRCGSGKRGIRTRLRSDAAHCSRPLSLRIPYPFPPLTLRKEGDSNPRNPNGFNGFRDRPIRPLSHLSKSNNPKT